MRTRFLTAALSVVIALLMTGQAAFGAALYKPNKSEIEAYHRKVSNAIPNWTILPHKINNLWLAVSNGGTFGTGWSTGFIDPITGTFVPSCEYPAGSDVNYLFIGALWAGAVIGLDTLVSVGFDGNREVREMWPDAGYEGAMIARSSIPTSIDYSVDAVSEQDYICRYTDTITEVGLVGISPLDNRDHIPIGLEIKQRTYAWSYDYADDFILFDYTIRNINIYPVKQMYLGIYIDADIFHKSRGEGYGWMDDIVGYLHDIPSPEAPGYRDTVRVAWAADNDGDPNGGKFDYQSATSVTGTAVLRSPNPDMKYSYNWWIASNYVELDWGPRMAGTPERPFRPFGTGLGSPDSDVLKYYIMSCNEFDYDQMESGLSHTDAGWLEPSSRAENISDGFDARYLFSFGPFDLEPGDTLPITLAYVAGENFHKNPRAFADYWDMNNPSEYYSQLGFENLGVNAKWAHWIFDNPGYDTDGDGDSGKVRWIIDSTTMDSTRYFYEGDGVPDFRGASPPPPPTLRVDPAFGRLRVRWNGQISENFVDVFSGQKDFEGYRVYYGEDNRATDYVMLSTYDRENYNIYTFDAGRKRWNLSEFPVSIDSIKMMFGEEFDPNLYTSPEESYIKAAVAYYFVPQDWNQDDLSNPLGIHRVYPDADPNDSNDVTEEGFHRFYEYEYFIDNLQPSKPYYISVTAFDYGSRKYSMSSLESSPNLNAVLAYPLPAADTVEDKGLEVTVYPNPYRIDGGYARVGYENRDRTKSAERSRSIHFSNLPKVCKIRIYTLAGDLVQEIDHYYPEGGPTAQHERWNLLSRNTQAVVTGIYIWQVKSDMGEQLGKLVIIK